MNDCQSAEMRDRLPDLLHDRLNTGERAAVLAHVDGCGDCRDELELLRGVHRTLIASTPRIDTARIVSALPKPGARVAVPLRPARSRWADWRVAATITVLAVGASSAALISRERGATLPPLAVAPDRVPDTAAAAIPVRPANDTTVARGSVSREAPSTTVAADETPNAGDQPENGMEGHLSTLSEQQLRALLNDIGQMKAVPITEPEPVTINVNSRTSSGSGDGAEWL